MPPKRFEGKFGIPASHPVESLLTSALYRLPESVNIKDIEQMVGDITARINTARESEGAGEALTEDEIQVLTLKLVRHYEDNGESAHLDIATMIDALVESPGFLKNDRGSMQKLFELHEMKTLQKIAEIRKRRAEITEHEGEGFNPYENLFETTNGQYYVAHLLNMPHLEDESDYMKHCVGTSTSYINKVKKGEVEIFSFRDKNTDQPVVTIEYDTKTHRLLQVKKYDDALPTLADEFAPDLIEAIELLGTTVNDKGETRTIASKEAVHLRQLLTLRDKNDKKEALTSEELCFLYEIDEKIKGFDIEREPLIAKLRKDRSVKEDVLTIFECTKDQIAHDLSEITENTKAYVGQLEPGIFRNLPETLEHVYISFPEKKVRRETVEIGGKSKEQLISEMEAQGIIISDYARSMMDNPGFVTGTSREEVKLVRLTVADLGFKTGVTTIDQIYERAQALGLELCPPDTGPNYLLQYKQTLNEYVRMGMKQITDSSGYRSVFSFERSDDGLWLGNDVARGFDEMGPGNKFVFRFRKVEA